MVRCERVSAPSCPVFTLCRAVGSRSSSRQVCPPLFEKAAKYGAMAPRLVVTITTNREIGLMRQCRQHVQIPGWAGRFHLSKEPTLERTPLFFSGDREVLFQERFTWREIGKPHVVDVPGGVLHFRHSTRRSPDSADSQPLIHFPVTSQPYDSNSHSCKFRSGSSILQDRP